MTSYPAPTADLASILQTLSAYAPPPPSAPYDSQSFPTSQHESKPIKPSHYDTQSHLFDLEDGEYDPSEYSPSVPSQFPPAPAPSPPKQPPSPPPKIQTPPRKRPALPSTKNITSYPLALRHITTHLLPLPTFLPRIRHLIKTQHTHERQWHAARLTLLKQLNSRDASRKKLDEVLASVGGTARGKVEESGLNEEEELRVYDRKVWKAQRDMGRAAEKELGSLGLPFFADGWDGKEEELKVLRARVVAFLEDLCGEETEAEGQ